MKKGHITKLKDWKTEKYIFHPIKIFFWLLSWHWTQSQCDIVFLCGREMISTQQNEQKWFSVLLHGVTC